MSMVANEIRDTNSTRELGEVKDLCADHKWDEIGGALGIFPFREQNLSAFSYDLTVGREAYSLRYSKKIDITEREPLRIEPGETVLVLIGEYIVLSPSVSAIVLGKVSKMNAGLVQSTTKIDPTWYGKFPVPLTNTSRSIMTLVPGDPFCTCVFHSLSTPLAREFWLTRQRVQHLGAESFRYDPGQAERWEPADPDHVTEAQIREVPKRFGPPFDVLVGGFRTQQRDLVDYMEQTWGTNAVREMKHALWEEEIKILREGRDQQVRLLQEQAEATRQHAQATNRQTWVMILAVVGWIVALLLLLLRQQPETAKESRLRHLAPVETSRTVAGSPRPTALAEWRAKGDLR